jgi:hypothetical protein
MAKQRGRRGRQGAKGPVGKPGPIGLKGATGTHGARGLTGRKGPSGVPGLKGAGAKYEAITGVYKQIDRIYQELDVQMKRMAQLQAELNEVRRKVQQMAAGSNDPLR